MLRLIRGAWLSRALWVAATLGIADLLEAGPRDAVRLAKETGTHAPSLSRLLRALCTVGVFMQDGDGRFALTPMGATLRSGVRDSVRAWATMTLDGEHARAWDQLMHSVRTGETAFEHVFGQDVWSYRAQHPAHGRAFDEAMRNLAAPFAGHLLAAYSFATSRRIVDVGGGDGTLVEAIVTATPGVRAVLLELPHVASKAEPRFRGAGLEHRAEVVAGNVFEAVPAGADAYILSRVLHDWSDEPAVRILKSCRQAMPSGSRLVVLERLLPERLDCSLASEAVALSDLMMMVMNGGRERTEAEYRALFEAAGLRHSRTVATAGEYSVIEAVPVG